MDQRQKTIRISCLGTPSDYGTSLVPLIIQSLGYKIQWVRPVRADLVIYGSFYDVHAPRLRWLPRVWRQKAGQWVDIVEKELSKRKLPPITLFHTAENLRHDHIRADLSISHDLDVESNRHFRLPYWMEMVDWSHEGLYGNYNPRFGMLLTIDRMQKPLGREFLKRPRRAIIMSSHLREPRASCLQAVEQCIPVDGFGPYFDRQIKSHHHSNFLKQDLLKKYAFNLCPENGLFPGYITEKIPEAFVSGCLPITCVDESVSVDFNPDVMINLKPLLRQHSSSLVEILNSHAQLTDFADQRLLMQRPSIEPFRHFIKNVMHDVSS
jgi:hypothetical protein